MRNRSPFSVFILTILTAGIYGLAWMAMTTTESNEKADDGWKPSGVAVVLLTLFTCGIYYIIWWVKMGTRVTKMTSQSTTGAMILGIIIFPVGAAMMTSQMNATAE